MEHGYWSASDFFSYLVRHNRLARDLDFRFFEISGLEGLEAALQAGSAENMVCVSDISEGYMELNNSPRSRSVKSVFMAMRHPVDDMDRRLECMVTMRELFRQFMSVLIREKVRLEENHIYLDPRISFSEIDRYFFTGGACCYFNIAVEVVSDLRLNAAEWIEDPSSAFSASFSRQFRCLSPAVRDI